MSRVERGGSDRPNLRQMLKSGLTRDKRGAYGVTNQDFFALHNLWMLPDFNDITAKSALV